MVAQLWSIIMQVITGFLGALVAGFNGITEIFYDATDGFTVIGQLLLIGLGMGIVYFAFRFIRGLIQR